jgi:hypothetical protein
VCVRVRVWVCVCVLLGSLVLINILTSNMSHACVVCDMMWCGMVGCLSYLI